VLKGLWLGAGKKMSEYSCPGGCTLGQLELFESGKRT